MLMALVMACSLAVTSLVGAADELSDALAVATEGILDNGTNNIYIDIYAKTYLDHAKQTTVGYQRSGCTWFAAARATELTGRNIPIYSGVNWWNRGAKEQGFKTGQVAKAKALACFSNHVSVIERVDGKVLTVSEGSNASASDAAHGYCVVRETTVDLFEISNYKGQEFYGYVYLGVGEDCNTAGSESYYNEHYSWVDEYLGKDNLPTEDTSPKDKNKVTVAKGSKDGQWHAYKKDMVQKNYTGIASNSMGWWRVENGDVNFDAEGVYENEYGWWYVKNGKVQFDHTGIQKNDYGWWRIEKGKVNFKAEGVFPNQYGWWYVKNGKVQFGYTGVQKNNYGWWRIEKGKVNFNYKGIAKNNYGTWYLENGKVDFSKNGKVTLGGKTYTVKNGKVQ